MKFAFLALALLGQFRQELPELPPQSAAPVAPKQVTPPPKNIPVSPLPKVGDANQGRVDTVSPVGPTSSPIKRSNAEPTGGVQTNEPAKPIAKVKLLLHHSRTGCKYCPPAAEWFKKWRGELKCETDEVVYPTLEDSVGAVPFLPCFEIVDADGVRLSTRGFTKASKHSGDSVCPGCINEWIRAVRGGLVEFDKPLKDQLVAAKRISIPAKQYVSQAFDVLTKAKVTRFSLRWHCNDGKRELRVWGKNPTVVNMLAVGGAGGTAVFAAPGSLLPDGQLEFGYSLSGPNRGKLRLELPFDFDSAPKASAAPPCGIDPFTILSAVTVVFKLLAMHADVVIPRDVEITGEFDGKSLDVNVAQGPQVVLRHLWTSESRLSHFNVTADKAVADFVGSRLLPRKVNVFLE